MVGNRHEPGAKGSSLWSKLINFAPQAEKDFLHNFFRLGAIQGRYRQNIDWARITVVQLTEGCHILMSADAFHERFIARIELLTRVLSMSFHLQLLHPRQN